MTNTCDNAADAMTGGSRAAEAEEAGSAVCSDDPVGLACANGAPAVVADAAGVTFGRADAVAGDSVAVLVETPTGVVCGAPPLAAQLTMSAAAVTTLSTLTPAHPSPTMLKHRARDVQQC